MNPMVYQGVPYAIWRGDQCKPGADSISAFLGIFNEDVGKEVDLDYQCLFNEAKSVLSVKRTVQY